MRGEPHSQCARGPFMSDLTQTLGLNLICDLGIYLSVKFLNLACNMDQILWRTHHCQKLPEVIQLKHIGLLQKTFHVSFCRSPWSHLQMSHLMTSLIPMMLMLKQIDLRRPLLGSLKTWLVYIHWNCGDTIICSLLLVLTFWLTAKQFLIRESNSWNSLLNFSRTDSYELCIKLLYFNSEFFNTVHAQSTMARKQRITSAALLVCPICMENQRDLRLLPCQHSVCLECLSQHISTSAMHDSFPCPVCRHQCKIPKGGAASMPPDFMASKLIDILATNANRRCMNWTTVNPHARPTFICFTCDHHLCSKCRSNHNMSKEMRSHHIISAQEEAPPSNSKPMKVVIAKCLLHKNITIDQYCMQCDDVACTKCIQQNHKDHPNKKISEISIEFSKKLNVLFESSISYIAHINKLLKDLQDTQEQIKDDHKKAGRMVTKSADGLWNNLPKMQKTIREKQERFLQKLKSTEMQSREKVEDAETAITACKEKAIQIQTRVEEVRRLDHGYRKVVRTLKLEEELQDLKTSEITCVSWHASVKHNPVTAKEMRTAKSRNQKIIGNISRNEILKHDWTPERKRPVEDPLFIMPLKYEGKYAVCGFAVTNYHIYVVHFYEPRVWIYNFSCPDKDMTCEVPRMEEPVGMICTSSDPLKLVITDNNKKIHMLALTKDHEIESHKVINTTYIPGSITMSKDQLVVASTRGDKIVLLDDNCCHIKDIPLTRHMFRWLRYAVAVDSGYVLVDGTMNHVMFADEKGMIQHTYGREKEDKMSAPKCVVQDPQGRTIVADFLHDRLHLLGPDHRRLQYLVTSRDRDIIHRPGCLELDAKNGLLFMSHGFVGYQEIRIYSYPVHHMPLTQYRRSMTTIKMELTLNHIKQN